MKNSLQKKLDTIELEISKLTTFKEKVNTLADYTKELTGAERFSLFVFKKDKEQLVSIHNDGIKGFITLKSNIGLVGYAFHKRKTVLENDVEHSSLFFKLVDKKLHYKTNTMLAVPLISLDHTRLGVIQLLNKKEGFTQEDKIFIVSLTHTIISLLNTKTTETTMNTVKNTQEISSVEKLQKSFDTYLENKRLFLMENGSAYYKILGMKREYFISADSCYQLTDNATHTKIHYYTVTNEFLSVDMLAQIDPEHITLLVSENLTLPKFVPYPLEEDET